MRHTGAKLATETVDGRICKCMECARARQSRIVAEAHRREKRMHGFTVVLIDSSEPSEGDFIYVESFESFQDMVEVEKDGSYPGWVDRIVQGAQSVIESREEQ